MKTLQEWVDFSGMYGTVDSCGIVLLHKEKPERINNTKYWKAKEHYIAITGCIDWTVCDIEKVYIPKGTK